MTKKSMFLVIKVYSNYYVSESVHCVCEDRKTANAVCKLANENARYLTYKVKSVSFVAKTNPTQNQ